MRIGFDVDESKLLEFMYENRSVKGGLSAKRCGVEEDYMLEMVKKKLVVPIGFERKYSRKVILYKIANLLEVLEDKRLEWKKYFWGVLRHIDDIRDDVLADRKKASDMRKVKKKRVRVYHNFDNEFKCDKRVSRNLYEHEAHIQQWKDDLLNGIPRPGRPPKEIIEWRKTIDFKSYEERIKETKKLKSAESRKKREAAKKVVTDEQEAIDDIWYGRLPPKGRIYKH